MTVSASAQRGLEFLRAGTRAFIDDDPTTIVLNRGQATRVEKPGGGYDFTPGAPRTAQIFKVINQTGDGSALTEAQDGIQTPVREYILLGAHDSVAEVGDWWVDGNNRYTVTELLVANGYERKWRVRSVGLEPNYG
ncbi:gp20 [Mycobacterium phage PLot]|uniref:Head-to-tail stopper n=16 Tax=Plotvirus TaxID=2169613 RepID=Q19YC9_9CAUD|nr:gp19 [Mycobacterium phage Troll4]YP_002241913.1 gp18 [Mycobacterium phage Gumball]YP_655216.1 gp20 [Mycobacterium phage PBI1]YP_655399.1 gp20 [Mycobacterium phage PLot]ACD49605.1 hypothetical protein Adjutor_20 [Mycobacterium phage Adjutor]ACI06307.1 hypothetical protein BUTTERSCOTCH_19 [Mycobacterium phage Butterscotch]AER49772.1 hypothetical protein NOVA_19 [Mycobacterium phage Nova]AVP43116.1 hypothetical protein PBI_BIGMAMA_17 [Mycobacterium phage BigMama]AWY03463.1 hypothetical prot